MTYGIKHQPLLATVQANRRKGGAPVAFIDGQLCFFSRDTPVPPVGSTVEVMIVRPIHPMDPENRFRDFDRLTGLEIQVVDPSIHMLVAIDGFEMSGSGCATSAFGCETDGSRPLQRADCYRGVGRDAVRLRDVFTVTPGRSGVQYAGERWTDGRTVHTDGTPTNVWVERDPRTGKAQRRSRVAGDSPTVRVLGLTRIEDLECASIIAARTIRKAA